MPVAFCSAKYSVVVNGYLNVFLIKLGKQLIFTIGELLEEVDQGTSGSTVPVRLPLYKGIFLNNCFIGNLGHNFHSIAD